MLNNFYIIQDREMPVKMYSMVHINFLSKRKKVP